MTCHGIKLQPGHGMPWYQATNSWPERPPQPHSDVWCLTKQFFNSSAGFVLAWWLWKTSVVVQCAMAQGAPLELWYSRDFFNSTVSFTMNALINWLRQQCNVIRFRRTIVVVCCCIRFIIDNFVFRLIPPRSLASHTNAFTLPTFQDLALLCLYGLALPILILFARDVLESSMKFSVIILFDPDADMSVLSIESYGLNGWNHCVSRCFYILGLYHVFIVCEFEFCVFIFSCLVDFVPGLNSCGSRCNLCLYLLC